MFSNPHYGSSPAGLSSSVALIEEFRQEIEHRHHHEEHPEDLETAENQSLLSASRGSTASARQRRSFRSRLGSRASHGPVHFNRDLLTPLAENAPYQHEHENAVVDDEASSIHLRDSTMKPMTQARMSARASFSSAFNSVYGGAGLSETTALLAPNDHGDPIFESVPPPIPEPDENAFIKEIGILGKYSLPILGTQAMQYSLLVTSVIIVGRVGTTELAAASLGSMTCNVLAFSVIQVSPDTSLSYFAELMHPSRASLPP